MGNLDIGERFRNDMKNVDPSVNVISKWTLAAENMTLISQMNSLRFEQLAIVDYEIMMHSDYFYGVGQSFFAHVIGLQRGNGSMLNCGCFIYDVPNPRFICCM